MHPCETCKQIQKQLNRKYLLEHNVGEDDLYEIVNSCECDKLNGLRIRWSGSCEEVGRPKNKKEPQLNHKKQRNRQERNANYQHKLKKLDKLMKRWFVSGCYLKTEQWDEESHEFVPIEKPYYKRVYRKRRSRYLKHVANKRVRAYRWELTNAGDYRKVFDFWYELW